MEDIHCWLIRCMNRNNKIHLCEVVKTLGWEIEQLGDGWKSVGDTTHSWLRVEDIFLGHWWTWNFLLQFFGVNPDYVFLWGKVKFDTFEENMGSTIEGSPLNSIWYLGRELSSFSKLKFLLSISDTFGHLKMLWLIRLGKSDHKVNNSKQYD